MEPQSRRDTRDTSARTVSFGKAFRFWVKLGFISFGGPAGQIAIMHRELVERRRWISEERFLHALNYCMLLPGPEAQQLATYVGWLLHRTLGGLVAGAFFVIPSIFILLALSWIYAAFGNVPAVAAVLWGFKPIVVAIVVEAVIRIGKRALKNGLLVAIAAVAFLAMYALKVPFPVVILSAGVAGLLGARLLPQAFVFVGPAPRPGGPASDRPIIDDAAPQLEHTRPSLSRAVWIAVIFLILWSVPVGGLMLWRGWSSVHAQEAIFFTKAALVTFGGAYSVLAYVAQAAVESYRWLTSGQMIDGLALAETTPGPLIMVLQFVGFMGAWNLHGDLSPATSAVLGALTTTYVTFLPCFFFIFLGAPHIEALRGNRNLGAALSGITAAVVGVVLNLAVFFGVHVLVPGGARVDWLALIVGAAAFLAMWRWKVEILWIVLAGGLAGLLRMVALGKTS